MNRFPVYQCVWVMLLGFSFLIFVSFLFSFTVMGTISSHHRYEMTTLGKVVYMRIHRYFTRWGFAKGRKEDFEHSVPGVLYGKEQYRLFYYSM
jgi:hypothetical protein